MPTISSAVVIANNNNKHNKNCNNNNTLHEQQQQSGIDRQTEIKGERESERESPADWVSWVFVWVLFGFPCFDTVAANTKVLFSLYLYSIGNGNNTLSQR